MKRIALWFAIAFVAGMPRAALAQAQGGLLNTGHQTTFAAIVPEQCQVAVPESVVFHITHPAAQTVATPVAVNVDHIVLGAAAERIKVSIKADALSFTPPKAGAATWSASDITWSAASWADGAGSSGVLSATSATTVAVSNPDVPSMQTAGLTFTLAAKPSVTCPGTHTLTMTWKVESAEF